MKLIILVIGLVLLVSTTSATDYYVSPTGNNGAAGTLGAPWATIDYAADNTIANDTIYLFDGTWDNEHVTFSHNYTFIKAYNGTPILDGLDKSGSGGIGIKMTPGQHCNVSGVTILNYEYGVQMYGHYNILDNCTIHDTESQTILMGAGGTRNNTVQKCELYNGTWNIIQISGDREPPNGAGVPSYNMSVINTKIHQSNVHSSIDLYGNIQDLLIEYCTFYNSTDGDIYHHSTGDWIHGVIIRHNTWEGFNGTTRFNKDCISLADASQDTGVEISNNTFNNFTVEGIYVRDAVDTIIENNEFHNTSHPIEVRHDATLINNYISVLGGGRYVVSGNHDVIIRNPRERIVFHGWDEGSGTFEFIGGTIYTVSNTGTGSSIPVRYYSTYSNSTRTASASNNAYSSATKYNMTLLSSTGYGKDVVVNTDLVADVSNITVNVSTPSTVTMTFLVDNASNTYNLSVDNIFNTSGVSTSDSIVSFDYTFPSTTPADFEVTWASSEGWSPTANTTYLGIQENWYVNETRTWSGTQPQQGDTVITGWWVVPE